MNLNKQLFSKKKNGKVSSQDAVIVVCLAYFVRYGYILLMLIVPWFIYNHGSFIDPFKSIFGICILMGLHDLVGLNYKWRHMYCAYQSFYHEKMNPFNWGFYTKQMKRDMLVLGLFWTILGVAGLVF